MQQFAVKIPVNSNFPVSSRFTVTKDNTVVHNCSDLIDERHNKLYYPNGIEDNIDLIVQDYLVLDSCIIDFTFVAQAWLFFQSFP